MYESKLPSHLKKSDNSKEQLKLTRGCFNSQLKVTSAKTQCRQFTIIPRRNEDRLADRNTKSLITVIHTKQRDTAYTSSCTYVPQPIAVRYNSLLVVSMHDSHVYLKINTRPHSSFDNRHVGCLPTSLLDHFVTTSKTPVIHIQKGPIIICLVLGLAYNIAKVVLLPTRGKST